MGCSAILGDFAAALALAGIFRFATHVAGLAAALAFATVEALAVMLRGGAVVAGAGARAVIAIATGRDGHCSGDQSRHGGGED